MNNIKSSKRTEQLRLCRVVTVPLTFSTLLQEQLQCIRQRGIELTLVSHPDPLLAQVSEAVRADYAPVSMSRSPSPWRDLIALLALTKLLRARRFDIVHSSTPKAGLLTALAGRLAGVPIQIHTFTGQVWLEKRGVGWRMLKAFDQLIASFNRHCYADSFSQRDFLVAEGVISPARISVLAAGSISGVSLERFNPARFSAGQKAVTRRTLGIPEGAFVILFVGRVTKDKGVVELVSALRLLQVEQEGIELVLVGPFESERDPLPQETLRELGDNGHVHLIGFSSEPEKYMAIADLFCLPSYREGFGSVIIEAAAMGLPAVATRVVGLVDAVVEGETGLLVPPRDVASLAQALRTMITSPRLLQNMGQAAQQRARRAFDAAVVNQVVVDEYYRLFDLKSGAGG